MTISPELIDLMAEASVPLDPVTDDGDTPLYYLEASEHGPLFAFSLKRLYPNAGRRAEDNKTPLELFILSLCSHTDDDPGSGTSTWDTIIKLCKGPESLDGDAEDSKVETIKDI